MSYPFDSLKSAEPPAPLPPPSGTKALASKIFYKIFKVIILSVVSFLVFSTSLLINLAQAINYLVFYHINRDVQRWINASLQDLLFSQMTTILEWYCGCRFRIFLKNDETRDNFGKEHLLAIGNHHFQIDSFFYWLLGNQFNVLGASKAFAKDELRYMPLLGWAFYFGDFIFLKRNWQEDMDKLIPAIDCLMSYNFPILLMLMPEGTRFTADKQRNSVKWAEQEGKPTDLKYHLYPRVKGFNFTLRHLRRKHDKFGLYNLQLVVPEYIDSEDVNMFNFIRGRPFVADIYIERISDSRLPSAQADESEYEKLLYEIFKKKDELSHEHHEYSVFPGCEIITRKRSVANLLIFLFMNFCITGTLFGALIWWAIVTHNVFLRFLIYGIVIVVYIGILAILVKIQNSSYGNSEKKKK